MSGAVTAGLLAPSGVVFFGLGELTGSVGVWETFIGGLLLIVMAIRYPDGVGGSIRARVHRWRGRVAVDAGQVAADAPITIGAAS